MMEDGREKKPEKSGQALAELAVFGALFLLILGALVTYGLKYNFQQQTRMTAFRRALAIAASKDPTGKAGQARGSGSYTLMQQKAMPDVMDLFGVGAPAPVVASASVTRSYEYMAPEDAGALPTSVIDIQTASNAGTGDKWMRRKFLSAGFRTETGLPTDSDAEERVDENTLDRLSLIYGSVTDLKTGTSAGNNASVRIIDGCSGNMPDYGTCSEQARMAVDSVYCTERCEDTKVDGDDMNCSAACSTSLAGHLPWYAEGGYEDAGKWVFPVLDGMFSPMNPTLPESASMGPQPDSTQATTRGETLDKTETSGVLTTQGSAQWSDVIDQSLIYRTGVNQATGYSDDSATLANEAYQVNVMGSIDETWTTNK